MTAVAKAWNAMRKGMPKARSRPGHSLARVRAISLGFGNKNTGTWNTGHAISQIRIITTPTRSGAVIVMAASDWASGRMRALRSTGALRQRGLGQPRRELPAMRREARGIAEALVARLRLVDCHDVEDAARPSRYHDDTGRQEHRLVDGMSDEKRGELARPPHAWKICIQ